MDIQKVMARGLAAIFVLSLGALGAYGYAELSAAPMRSGVYCARCDRVLHNANVSGEIVANKYVAQPFRTIRCMMTHLRDTPADESKIFVADYRTTRPVPVQRAHFVRVPSEVLANDSEYGVGDYDYLAFRSASVAREFADRYDTVPRTWTEIRDLETAVGVVAHRH